MNKIFLCLLMAEMIAANVYGQVKKSPDGFTISREVLMDKIKGGWAGQTIGVTFGGPTEFRFNGTFIQEDQPIRWYDGYIKHTMDNSPGLYDDIYMDLTFVDVIERLGPDAPVDSFAHAFAYAQYDLWHANQAARYNILRGLRPPATGHWINNPHADDIDFQIEADFSGLMSPGMPNAAIAIGDSVGHIMNYGDGWYGGVYVGAMYSLAFISNDINYIVKEALKAIPEKSQFYQCIADVIRWYEQYPGDWKQNWFEIQKKWSSETGCPEGVFIPYNIDAKVNAAYIVLGLLYGQGDYTKTLEISTRAGQDSDCNPSSAGGILGAMLGYNRIPAYWKMGLIEAESQDFKYTSMSLNDVYSIGFKHALQMIKKNGGRIDKDRVFIPWQPVKTVRFEKNFDGLYAIDRRWVGNNNIHQLEFEFEGNGFSLRGDAVRLNDNIAHHDFEADLYIDGKKLETLKLPTQFTTRRYEIAWKYDLPVGLHRVRLEVKNPSPHHALRSREVIIYDNKPAVHHPQMN